MTPENGDPRGVCRGERGVRRREDGRREGEGGREIIIKSDVDGGGGRNKVTGGGGAMRRGWLEWLDVGVVRRGGGGEGRMLGESEEEEGDRKRGR